MPQNPILKKMIKKVLLGVTLLVLFSLVAFSTLILPNQVRSVSVPPALSSELNVFLTPDKANAGDKAPVGGSDVTSATLTGGPVHTDPASTWTTETLRAAAQRIVDEAAKPNWGIPDNLPPDQRETYIAWVAKRKNEDDPANWSPEERTRVEQARAEAINLMAEYLALPNKTRNLPYMEADAIDYQMQEKIKALYERYDGKWGDNRKIDSPTPLPGRRLMLFVSFWEIQNKTRLQIAIDHQEWVKAGNIAWNIAWYNKDYDRAIYYFRQGGVVGRIRLASETFQAFMENKIIQPWQKWRSK